MEFDSENIRTKKFSIEKKGFNQEEVSKYLEELAEEFNTQISKISDLTQRIEELNFSLVEYQNIEKQLRDSVIYFNESEQTRLQKSKDDAEKIIGEAEEKSKQIMQEAEEEAKSTRDTLLFLNEQKEIFTARLKIIIDSQEGMLLDLKNNNSAELQKSMAEAAAFRAQTELNIEKILEKLL
ncbi:MAG: DivIVA domain-containing protein [Melioribacteraceae bacterium]|jgi:cell division initiation protein|nr:DivIVA domain-containing protein [Melioribacteraceae bacterium]